MNSRSAGFLLFLEKLEYTSKTHEKIMLNLEKYYIEGKKNGYNCDYNWHSVIFVTTVIIIGIV